ncbi:MAG TPA: hypothetical protein VFQ68_16440 [Streptosporangiaceae bacterium]|nr:hypothetical protein [Streptosporangiaceae bacterium]
MTTEDPCDYGLTAADLREAADLLYEPGDRRAAPSPWTHDQQVRRGQIRSRLRGLADALDAGLTGHGEAGQGPPSPTSWTVPGWRSGSPSSATWPG